MNPGLEWLNSLPEQPTKERDEKVLEAAKSGLLKCDWNIIFSKIGNDELALFVGSDACYVEIDDNKTRFRPQCSAILQQKVADIFNASLPTSKIMDLRHSQADIVVDAVTLTAVEMSTTTKSKQYNELVEKKRDGKEGILSDSGKTWCLSNKLSGTKGGGGINYGFYSKSASSKSIMGQKIYQTEGTRHLIYEHSDYSQLIHLVYSECLLNNNVVKLIDIMKDKNLSKLVNYDGVLKYTRQPGV